MATQIPPNTTVISIGTFNLLKTV